MAGARVRSYSVPWAMVVLQVVLRALDESRTRSIYCNCMIPLYLHTLFWDTNLDNFDPTDFPEYTITRVLEYGDRDAVSWLRQTFSQAQIVKVVRTERRLSRKSANFWALIYGVSPDDVAALRVAS